MKLQKFKEKNNKQKSIIVFTIACILLITGVFLYKTFASFQVVENEDLINGSIEDPGDVYFAFYQDGEITKTIPEKNTGYAYDYEKSNCNKGAVPYFDSIDWSITVKGMNESHTKCTLYFYKGYQDENLHGTDPVLERPLIPVHIDETGKVTKADPSQKWYDYAQKQWANAVILVDETKQYEIDEVIEEKDIESYFVWIPRYKYKLKADEETLNGYKSATKLENVSDLEGFYIKIGGNKGASEAFEIEFENNTTLPSNGTKIDEWLTHPAFTSFNCNGFWVGKFETGYNQSSDISKEITTDGWTKDNAKNNIEDPSKVIIKPNVYSWRLIQVANAFYTSYNYQRELDSHMMKNSEWGAVAYLTQSKYGRCTSDKGSCEEVRINNVETNITGYSAKNAPTCTLREKNIDCNRYETVILGEDGEYTNNYFNSTSILSSTTENYSGIYDMSGGTHEYVMGVMQGSSSSRSPASGRSRWGDSGFKGLYTYCQINGGTGTDCGNDISNTEGKEWPSSKYYDLYEYYIWDQQFQRGHLGDATKELGPIFDVQYPEATGYYHSLSYHADAAHFLDNEHPFFLRGGYNTDGIRAGIFTFVANYGIQAENSTFRIILTP